jgi:hypothetical protein
LVPLIRFDANQENKTCFMRLYSLRTEYRGAPFFVFIRRRCINYVHGATKYTKLLKACFCHRWREEQIVLVLNKLSFVLLRSLLKAKKFYLENKKKERKNNCNRISALFALFLSYFTFFMNMSRRLKAK